MVRVKIGHKFFYSTPRTKNKYVIRCPCIVHSKRNTLRFRFDAYMICRCCYIPRFYRRKIVVKFLSYIFLGNRRIIIVINSVVAFVMVFLKFFFLEKTILAICKDFWGSRRSNFNKNKHKIICFFLFVFKCSLK